ncbi:EamA family transporter [Acinetobacter sp. ANC 4173]|uniref:EamA family transporter n=1 Tax=Acinetobacter sp. ANC 4173 TaxID=2529837 RepID=UPI00103ABFC8|nr:EamA family transporter [Acinetobacter sp. ANC 4173]TCB82216.1 EamA family transporter [Acinetobacter sp. ANC 4173]
MNNIKVLSILYMLLSMISTQFSASIAKQMIMQLDALTVTIFRIFFAAIISFILFKSWRIIPKLKLIDKSDLILYTVALCVMNTLFYFSLGKLPMGIAVGLEFTGPLLLALLSIKQRIDYLWVGFAIVGILLMVPWSEALQLNFSFLGAICALGAGFCWALYIYYGQRVATANLGIHALSLALCFSSAILLPIGFIWHPEPLLTPSYWLQGLLIAIFAAAFPYTLDILALKNLTKLSYGTLSSLSPVLAALAGLIFLHEYLSLLQWIALFFIMVASIGVTLRKESVD